VTPTTMFGLGALIEIVPLALLLLLDPRKTRAAFAADAEKAEAASQREG